MDDYCNGIAYATGYMANDAQKPYLVVRNLDPWYANQIATATGGTAYKSMHNIDRDGKPQHGVLDMTTAINRDGSRFKKPRLRIYGSEEIIEYINNVLPAKNKKVQYIKKN